MRERCIRCSSRSSGRDVRGVGHVVVDEETADVGDEVVVGVVVAVSSRAIALPKNLIAPLPYRITRGGVPEACCHFSRCTPEGGMDCGARRKEG